MVTRTPLLRFAVPFGVLAVLALAGCAADPDAPMPDAPTSAVEAPAFTPEADAPVSEPAPPASAGTANVSFDGSPSISGTFPVTLCGAPYMMGNGVAYQAQAGDWQITVAVDEQRLSGDVPLNMSDEQVRVVATANGPGTQYVRGPRQGGSLRISEDFRRAEADLELRPILGGETAHLQATFVCE